MRLFIAPTRIPARPGARLMLWGNHVYVQGVTDRFTFVSGDSRFRLVLTDKQVFEGRYHHDGERVEGLEQDGEVRVDASINASSVIASGSAMRYSWRFERLPLCWQVHVGEAFNGDCWPIEPVHAGLVPCARCLRPTPTARLGGVAECDCGASPIEQLQWMHLPHFFSFPNRVFPEHGPYVNLSSWYKVLGTSGRGS